MAVVPLPWIPSMPPADDQQRLEDELRRFLKELLRTQEYDFVKDEDQFSQEKQRQILTRLCDVIAENLKAESCTIHLQMYDPKSRQADELFEDHVRRHPTATDQFQAEISSSKRKRRERICKSALTFPYWKYPKGAALLAARNRRGPWVAVSAPGGSVRDNDGTLRATWKDGVAVLSQGLTKEIVQGNIPRVCDRRTVRPQRGMKKLGSADMHVWTNDSWERMFRNYYGVPIQIHHAGEAIGLLKVENKRSAPVDLDNLDESEEGHGARTTRSLSGRIRLLKQRLLKHKPSSGQSRASLFSIAYLIHDLERIGETALSLSEVIYIPFRPAVERPKATDEERSRFKEQYATLLPAENERPPVQMLFPDHETEEELVGLLKRKARESEAGATIRYYNELSHQLTRSARGGLCPRGEIAGRIVQITTEAIPGQRVDCFPEPTGCVEAATREQLRRGWQQGPDYCYRVVIGEDIEFQVLVPPTMMDPEGVAATSQDPIAGVPQGRRRQVMAEYFDREKLLADPTYRPSEERLEWSGEHAYVTRTQPPTNEKDPPDTVVYRVVDFVTDRLAARTNAFVESQSYNEFTQADAHKLSWAAFEIGKFIERMISYRAGHSTEDPMPLTAMEFYRLPISNLSFVDDLRERRHRCRRIKGYLDYHLERVIEDLNIRNETQYKSRIKDYRSFLGRLGERFEGFRRGNIAIWLYLLADELQPCTKHLDLLKERLDDEEGKLAGDTSPSTEGPTNRSAALDWIEHRRQGLEFLKHLTEFQSRVVEAVEVMGHRLEFSDDGGHGESASPLLTDAVGRLSGLPVAPFLDLKFDSPPFQYVLNGLHNYSDPRGAWEDVLRRAVHRVLWNLAEERLIDADAVNEIAACTRPDRDLMQSEKEWESVVREAYAAGDGSNPNQTVAAEVGAATERFKERVGDRKEALERLFNREANSRAIPSLLNLVVRNYDSFSQSGVSLLLQLLNLLRYSEEDSSNPKPGEGGITDWASTYFHAYTVCFQLRDLLSTSARQIEDEPEFMPLKFVFGDSESKTDKRGERRATLWQSLEDYLDRPTSARGTHDASSFEALLEWIQKVLGDSNSHHGDPADLCRSSLGIYKRIRTLANVLRHQRSAATLDWELGRFDLLGARINCLFKGQVFLVYERIWNSGEPFYRSKREPVSPEDLAEPLSKMLGSRSRMRWLCVRSKVMEGEYNALQIAGFMDPDSFQRGHWDSVGLNLNRIRIVFHHLIQQFDRNWYLYYRNYAFHRFQTASVSEDWNRIAAHVRSDAAEVDQELEHTARRVLWYGLFLYEGVVDILLFLLEPPVSERKARGLRGKRVFGGGEPLVDVEIVGPLLLQVAHQIREAGNLLADKVEKYVNRFHGGSLDLNDLHTRDAKWPEWVDGDRKVYEIGRRLLGIFQQQLDKSTVRTERRERVTNLILRIQKNLEYEEELWLDSRNMAARLKRAIEETAPLASRCIESCDRLNRAIASDETTIDLHALCADVGEHISSLEIKVDAKEELKRLRAQLSKRLLQEERLWEGPDGHRLRQRRRSVPALYVTDYEVRLNRLDSRVQTLLSDVKGLESKARAAAVVDILELLTTRIKELRRAQKSHLMDERQAFNPLGPAESEEAHAEGGKPRRAGGLWMRRQDQVLNRLKNLIFLYHPSDLVQGESRRMRTDQATLSVGPPTWAVDQTRIDPAVDSTREDAATLASLRAYDLFYYLRDLVPVEIQIRTKLADTVAEQYHDAVYKGKPPLGTEIERVKLEEMGKLVDDIDRELEIDYEDYVTKYWFDILENRKAASDSEDDSKDSPGEGSANRSPTSEPVGTESVAADTAGEQQPTEKETAKKKAAKKKSARKKAAKKKSAKKTVKKKSARKKTAKKKAAKKKSARKKAAKKKSTGSKG